MSVPDSSPLVTIVTPVYNGAEHLAEAFESVRGQTYAHWEYIILDNRSTDGSGELAEELASRDPRVRALRPEQFVSQYENWNRAMDAASPESRYTTLLCADDWLYPRFIEAMVAVGEQSSRVGLIGCYRREGALIAPQGTGLFESIIPGPVAARHHLRLDYRLFSCPSAMMYRSELVRRAGGTFYPDGWVHADIAVCYEVLNDWDFGFVQEVLSFNRMHDASVTANRADRLGTIALEDALMAEVYGPRYFEGADLADVRARTRKYYYYDLHRRRHLPDSDKRLAYQRERWAEVGGRFSRAALVAERLKAAVKFVLNPDGILRVGRRRPNPPAPVQPDPKPPALATPTQA